MTSGRYTFTIWETTGSSTGTNPVGALVSVGMIIGVSVLVAMGVSVPVAIGSGVLVAVGVAVPVAVGVAVLVVIGVAVPVAVGVAVLVVIGVAVPVAVGVAVLVAVGVAVPVAVGVAVLVAVGVAVPVAVGVAVSVAGGVPAHPTEETMLESIVTAPVRAKALPDRVAPLSKVILASASTLPTNIVPVPSVAELPTCQNTLQAEAPLIRRTDALLAVVSALPIWKMKTALGSPWPLSVSAPVNCADVLGKQ